METSQANLEISQRDVERIITLCNIAKINGAVLSLKDVVLLTTLNVDEEELERLWANNYALNSAYSVDSGYVFERNLGLGSEFKNFVTCIQDKDRADWNFRHARSFSSFILSPTVRLVAVSGSTSYDSSRLSDDVDFFCVIRRNNLWVFMLKSLLLARIDRLRHRKESSICFSCVMDEERAIEEFREAKDPLFARDALTARPLHGLEYFQGLLRVATWMGNFYPKLYLSKLKGKTAGSINDGRGTSALNKVLNSYLFHILGRYIRLKSNVLNRRLAKERKASSIFTVRLGEDHCIYESERYKQLRETYSKLREK